MTSFVHVDIATRHAGAERLEAAAQAAKDFHGQAFGSRGLATLLLSAIAAAVMVAAYQVMDSVAEGHLLVMWVALWAVAFATLALLAGSARNLAARIKASADAWSRGIAQAKSDQRLWAAAKTDARVMNDLQAAITRNEQDFSEPVRPTVLKAVAGAKAVKLAGATDAQVPDLRPYQRHYI